MRLLFLLFTVLSLQACQQKSGFDPTRATSFSVGGYAPMCSGEDKDCFAAFRLVGDELFEDTLSQWPGSWAAVAFDPMPYEPTGVADASSLLADFPESIWHTPTGNQYCAGCDDGGVLVLELQIGEETRHWEYPQPVGDAEDELSQFLAAALAQLLLFQE